MLDDLKQDLLKDGGHDGFANTAILETKRLMSYLLCFQFLGKFWAYHADLGKYLAPFARVIGGDSHNGYGSVGGKHIVLVRGADMACGLDAVENGHVDIKQDEIVRALTQHVEGLDATAGEVHLMDHIRHMQLKCAG